MQNKSVQITGPAHSTLADRIVGSGELNLAYLIVAHKNFEQVKRLICRLDNERSYFVLLIDAKTPRADFERLRASINSVRNVRFAERIRVSWGTISTVKAALACIRELLNWNVPFDYAFLLTGQDYPLVSRYRIERELLNAGGRSFIHFDPFPRECWRNGGFDRIDCWHFLIGNRRFQMPRMEATMRRAEKPVYAVLNRLVPRRGDLPGGLRLFGGSASWILSCAALRYIDHFILGNPTFLRRFRFTAIADEFFFQTILANSPLRSELINDNGWFIQWTEGAAHPAVLTVAELPALLRCGKLFARKFDVTVDTSVLDQLDLACPEDVPRVGSSNAPDTVCHGGSLSPYNSHGSATR